MRTPMRRFAQMHLQSHVNLHNVSYDVLKVLYKAFQNFCPRVRGPFNSCSATYLSSSSSISRFPVIKSTDSGGITFVLWYILYPIQIMRNTGIAMYDLSIDRWTSINGACEEKGTHVTKVAFVNGMNVSNPLNIVIIRVDIRANQDP